MVVVVVVVVVVVCVGGEGGKVGCLRHYTTVVSCIGPVRSSLPQHEAMGLSNWLS